MRFTQQFVVERVSTDLTSIALEVSPVRVVGATLEVPATVLSFPRGVALPPEALEVGTTLTATFEIPEGSGG
jgi:hypothetical protein